MIHDLKMLRIQLQNASLNQNHSQELNAISRPQPISRPSTSQLIPLASLNTSDLMNSVLSMQLLWARLIVKLLDETRLSTPVSRMT